MFSKDNLVKRVAMVTAVVMVGLIVSLSSTNAWVRGGISKLVGNGNVTTVEPDKKTVIMASTTIPSVSNKPVTQQYYTTKNPNKEKQPILIIDSTLAGFEPEEINVQAGVKALLIRNRTGLDRRTYIITYPDRPSEKVLTRLGEDSYSTKLQFTPGDIIVKDSENISSICRIHITP